MAMRYKYLTLSTVSGWTPTGITVVSGERLSIIPETNYSTSRSYSRFANPKGNTTDIYISPGDNVSISASGTWTWQGSNTVGPTGNGEPAGGGFGDWEIEGVSKYSLVGRIGSGSWFYIGTDVQLVASSSGYLSFNMNDDFPADNGGSLTVQVTINGGCPVNARIGGGTSFEVGQNYDGVASTSGSLELSLPACSQSKIKALVIVDAPGVPNHNLSCQAGAHDQEPTSGNPIQLRDGDKVLEATDLSLQSPAAPLTLTRYYRQSKQSDPRYQFMGLGWSHNHQIELTLQGTPSVPRIAEIFFGEGNTLKLTETAASSGVFVPLPGSATTLTYNAGLAEYRLELPDHTAYHFDAISLKLKRRSWNVGGDWTYSYYVAADGTDLNGKLKTVSDGYGRSLTFTYIRDSNPSAYQRRKLYRVTDHASRYIEFSYAENKVNSGGIIGGGNSVLTGVRDVMGRQWVYDYDTTNIASLNYLTKRWSPNVDVNGDTVVDGAIKLEDLTYIFSGSTLTNITQKRGNDLHVQDFLFKYENRNVTAEVNAGRTSLHHFANGIYVGKTNPASQMPVQALNDQYRPEAQVDANGNETQLEWSSNGKTLTKITNALNQETSFAYDTSDRLISMIDAQGRKTEYTYDTGTNSPLPLQIKVFKSVTGPLESWCTFQYNAGRITEEKVLDPTDSTGNTVLNRTTRTYATSGNSNGLLFQETYHDLKNPGVSTTTSYTYDNAGRVVKLRTSSLFGSCKFTYHVYDTAGNVLATVCGRQDVTAPTSVGAAIAMYDASDPAKNVVTTHEYDTLNRRVKTTTNAGSTASQTTLTFYDALDRVARTVQNYVNQIGGSTEAPGSWVWNATSKRWEKSATNTTMISHGTANDQNIITDTLYNERGMIRLQRDPLGNVTLYGYDLADRLVKVVRNAATPGYNNNYSGTAPDPALASYTQSTISDVDLVTESEYDAAGNLVKSTEYLPGNADKGISIPNGAVSTFYVYDALNRLTRTVRSAKTGATIASNLGDSGYIATNDPRSMSYAISVNPDRDLIEETEYDSLGRVIVMRRLMEHRPTAVWETTLYGYDALGRQVKNIRNASVPTYDLNVDPDLSSYTASSNADQDIITSTVYDAEGRVQYTTDPVGIQTWYAYDGYDRLVKTIVNPGGTGSPIATNYVPSSDPDKDLISVTEYNSNGKVKRTQNALGYWTLYGYDLSDRLVRTIANASNPTYNTGADGSLANYTPSANSDEDIITSTVYDVKGRVQETTDTRGNVTRYTFDALDRRTQVIVNYVSGSTDVDRNRTTTTTYDLLGRITSVMGTDGRTTLYLYDQAGRRTRTVVNYVVQGTTNPKDWVWVDGTPGSWKVSSAGGAAAVSHGTNNDQNLISDTVYGKSGVILNTRDARGSQMQFSHDAVGRQYLMIHPAVIHVGTSTATPTKTYTCFDKVGRVLRVIEHFTDSGAVPDAKTGSAWTYNPPTHGTNNDQDLITLYEYDAASRPIKVTDPLGNFTETTYFKDGQVESVTQPKPDTATAGMITKYRYDGVRRRNKVVQGYQASPGSTDVAQWKWNAAASPARWEEN